MIIKKITLSLPAIFFIGCLLLIASTKTHAQVYGCRDPLASNYNSMATVNDGSCTYPVTAYTPPVKVNRISDTLVEGSGLQMAGNYLWSFNDGGGQPAIYRIDTISNQVLQKVVLSGARNIDWEDIAFDGTSFFIGDFGNNANGARTDLKIYTFPFTAIPDFVTNPVATIPAAQIGVINFSYSDQPQPPQPTTSNLTKFDCEAMIVDQGKLHLFTKNWIDLNTTHYIINSIIAGTYSAIPLETLPTNYLVTAADKMIGRPVVVLLGYKASGFADHFMHLLTGYSGGNYFNGNKRLLNLPNVLEMGQAEGLCFRSGTYGYISNERFAPLSINPKLRSFEIGTFISATTTSYKFNGNGDWNNAANWSNNLVPPSSLNAGDEILIEPAIGGVCVLNIPYSISPGATLTVISSSDFIIQGNLTIEK